MPSGPASSVIFSAGWYTTGENVDSPEQLDVALDKESYKSGETAKLRIASKLGGKALITVLGTGLDLMKEVEIAKGGGEVEIPVSDAWGPGAYVTALLYRPLDEVQKRMPSRAIGIRWLPIDQSGRELKVAVTLPEKVKSGSDGHRSAEDRGPGTRRRRARCRRRRRSRHPQSDALRDAGA